MDIVYRKNMSLSALEDFNKQVEEAKEDLEAQIAKYESTIGKLTKAGKKDSQKYNKATKGLEKSKDKFKEIGNEAKKVTKTQKLFLKLANDSIDPMGKLGKSMLSLVANSPMGPLIRQTMELQKAFKDLKKVMGYAFLPLTQAKKLFDGIFSVARSLVMTPFNFLKDAVSSMFELAKEKTATWWDARVLGTSTRNLSALQSVDKAFGMGGTATSAHESFAKSVLDYSKHGGILAQGITNEDMAKWAKGGDSVENFFEMLQKVEQNAINTKRDPNSRAYFEQAKVGDSLGISFEQYTEMLKILPQLTQFYKEQRNAIKTSDKTMLAANKTQERLNVAFENLKVMLTEKFGRPLLKIVNKLTPALDRLATKILSDENVKKFSDLLDSLANQFINFMDEDGINKLSKWAKDLVSIFGEMVYKIAWGLNKINLLDDDSFKTIFKEQIERDKIREVFQSKVSRVMASVRTQNTTAVAFGGGMPVIENYDIRKKWAEGIAKELGSIVVIGKQATSENGAKEKWPEGATEELRNATGDDGKSNNNSRKEAEVYRNYIENQVKMHLLGGDDILGIVKKSPTHVVVKFGNLKTKKVTKEIDIKLDAAVLAKGT